MTDWPWIVDHVDVGVVVADDTGNRVFINRAAQRIFGIQARQATVAEWFSMVPLCGPDGVRIPTKDLPLTRALNGETIYDEEFYAQVGDTLHHLLGSALPLEEGGAFVLIKDVTVQRITAKKLRLADRMYRLLAKNLPKTGVMMFDRDFRYILAEGEVFAIAGLSVRDVEGKLLEHVLKDDPERVARVRGLLTNAFYGHESTTETEYNGRVFRAHYIPVRDEAETIVATMVVSQDVTEVSRSEITLRTTLAFDPQTSLLNRRGIEAAADNLLCRGKPLTVLAIDLDGFKAVNDAHGHAAGDTVLRVVADRIRGCIRTGDLAARFGGDEFVVVVTGELTAALGAARRIVESVARTIATEMALVVVTASIGVASAEPQVTFASAHALADHALLEAKRGGKNQVRVSV